MKKDISIQFIKTSELKLNEKNPRKNDNAVDTVAKSIERYGFKNPIIADSRMVVYCGNTRLKAARKLGLETVPVIVADDLTAKEIRELAIIDNKSSEIAEWDMDMLAEELEDLDLGGFDLDFDLGVDDKAVTEDEPPEPNEEDEPICKLGDIWLLGKHRLMCGDSTDKATVERLMNGEKADMVFTDPPYGMKKEAEGVLNDNLNFDDLLEFNKKWIPITLDALKDLGSWYCWGIDEPLMDMYSHILKPLARKNKIVLRNYITWAKHSAFGMKSSLMLSYPRETEKCWFIVKGKNWNNNNVEFFNYKYQSVLDYLNGEAAKVGLNAKNLHELTGVKMWGHWFSRSQFTVIPQRHYETLQRNYKDKAFLLSYDELRNLIGAQGDKKEPVKPFFDLTWFDDGDIPLTDVWRNSTASSKERENTGSHATPKPLAICERAIVTSSRKNELVLDLFGGSGSTLIACEQLGRRCYTMELDPRYCDVIIKRWENLTGRKAICLKK